ncbi:MAG: arylsulfatase [Planctomycetota bacterium]
MMRRTILGLMVLIAVSRLLPTCELAAAEQNDLTRPNVIFILTDDQGWADVGYNNPKVYSPHIDSLARSGVILNQNYVMPQCTPTRVALMTGRYPGRFGPPALAASNQPAFPKGTPTLAAMFKQAGYETYLCGKWHLGSTAGHGPNHFGFDHSYGSLAGAVGMYDHRYRKGKFENTWHRNHRLIEGHENGTHATDLVMAEAVRIIQSDRKRSFFLYLPFQSVHTPLDERGEFTDVPTQLDPDDPGRWLNEDKITWFNDPNGVIQSEKDPGKRLFLAAVHHLDYAIGEIVSALERTGQRENTIIIFSSDNGPQGSWAGNAYPDDLKLTDFNQSLSMRGKKIDVWEGGIRVPGFINWPSQLKPKELDQPVHIVDWFPTLTKLVNATSPESVSLDGINIWPTLKSGAPIADRSLYWTWNNRINRWAIRFKDWKVVKYGQGAPEQPEDWQLFNLQNDPQEQTNIGEQYSAKRSILHQQFLDHRKLDRVGGKN